MGAGPHRILQLVRNLDVGGAQEVVVTLASRLSSEGHEVIVGTLKDGPVRSEIQRAGIPVVVLEERRRPVTSPMGFLADMWRLRRRITGLIDDHGIDIVQTHLLRSVDFVVASLSRRVSVVWTFHNVNFTLRREHLSRHGWLLTPKRVVYRTLYRAFARRVAAIVAVSDEVGEVVDSYLGGAQRVTVIHNGVDTARFTDAAASPTLRDELRLQPDDRLMLMVGTFKEQKGHRHLIDAVARLHAGTRRLTVALVGDGPLRDSIARLVEEMNMTERVRFLGNRRDVPSLLATADYFVLPSLWEGLPMALLEAMAAGLPCLATRVSGSAAAIVPGVSGLLVPPGDADALADGIEYLLADDDRAAAMGAAARERVETRYSAVQQARTHLALFDSFEN